MKICMSSLCAARFVVLAVFILICCSDPGVDPAEGGGGGGGGGTNNEELTPEEANAFMETFSFIAATKVTGALPDVTNSALTKTSSKDTIYTLPGVQDVIRISHPESRRIKGIFFTVPGSTFYYNVEIEREEASDTVSVTFFEIDPEDIEEELESGSTSIPIEIVSYDESNEPIDVIERVMTIEKPANACDIFDHTWFWEWSALVSPNGHPYNLNCRGERYKNDFIFKDCCLGVPVCPVYDENKDPIYDVEIDISLFYTITAEWMRFYSDGLFERQTMEQESYISNPGEDPSTFDPCSWVPEIDRRVETVDYWGTHDYVPGDNNITYIATNTSCAAGEIGCGFGGSVSNAEVIVTCHTLVLKKGSEGGKSVRLFTRGKTADMEGEILDGDKFWR